MRKTIKSVEENADRLWKLYREEKEKNEILKKDIVRMQSKIVDLKDKVDEHKIYKTKYKFLRKLFSRQLLSAANRTADGSDNQDRFINSL